MSNQSKACSLVPLAARDLQGSNRSRRQFRLLADVRSTKSGTARVDTESFLAFLTLVESKVIQELTPTLLHLLESVRLIVVHFQNPHRGVRPSR